MPSTDAPSANDASPEAETPLEEVSQAPTANPTANPATGEFDASTVLLVLLGAAFVAGTALVVRRRFD